MTHTRFVFWVCSFAIALAGCGEDSRPAPDRARTDDAGAVDGASTPDERDADVTRVRVKGGELRGAVDGKVRHFFGIPYAKPPLGALRWKAPVPSEAWTGVRDALEMSAKCAQPQSLSSGARSVEEDCLYLNVWTPVPAPAKPLPVLFWIHGGGNESGSTRDETPIVGGLFYDGGRIVAAHDVVVVSINYRLGALGFFSHPALRAEGSQSGNQGLLDQRLALQWVRDNIATFGGDPKNVTIFGESAGARNVCYQVVAPGSRGLFRRAISESGDCIQRVTPRDEAEAQVAAYVDAVGCKDATDTLACLRALSADALVIPAAVTGAPPEPLPGSAEYQGSKTLWSFGPTVDGNVVTDQPRSLFASGDVADVEYLLGTNGEEGALRHYGSTPATTEADFTAALERAFDADGAKELEALYPVSDFPTPNDALIRVTTDWKYSCAVQDFAERIVASGKTAYAYNFDHAWAAPSLRDALGKSHGAELNYVFGSFVEGMYDAEAKTLSELMQRYWTRFATSGDPNGAPDPTWPAFDPAVGNRLNLNAAPAVVEHFREERCKFWKKYYAAQF